MANETQTLVEIWLRVLALRCHTPASLKCTHVTDSDTGLPCPGDILPDSQLDPGHQPQATPYVPIPNGGGFADSAIFLPCDTISSPDIRNHRDQTPSQKDNLYATDNLYSARIQTPWSKLLSSGCSSSNGSPTLTSVNDVRIESNNPLTCLTPEGAKNIGDYT